MQLPPPRSSCSPRADDTIMQRFRAVAREVRTVKYSSYTLAASCKTSRSWAGITETAMDTGAEVNKTTALEKFVAQEAQRGINAAVLIGRSPELYLEQIATFRKYIPRLTLHTSGLDRLPIDGFEDVTIAISLFGDGQDRTQVGHQGGGHLGSLNHVPDAREKSPNRRLDRSLINYSCDPRAVFIYTVSDASIPHMDDTIKRIAQHGLRVFLNYSVDSRSSDPQKKMAEQFVFDKVLAIKERYPNIVVGHPYFIRALITGKSHWGTFSYQSCPSISQDHPDNAQRIANGNHFLPKFNAWPADRSYPDMCYASGVCNRCRDSQALSSWLLVNVCKFMSIENGIQLWTEIAEAHFSQFIWSPYHPLYHRVEPDSRLDSEHIFALSEE